MEQKPLIESLSEKIGRLIADSRAKKQQVDKLLSANRKLKEERAVLQQRLSELEHRVKVLELSVSMGGSVEQKRLASARINRLMREVDKCIALINK